MLKKLMTAFLTLSLIFAPVGGQFLLGQDDTVSAKSYKSGKRSFNTNRSTTNNNSNIQSNKKSDATTKSNTKAKSNPVAKGGLMKGILYGGIAGLLFGSLFANMGGFGAVLGFMVNVIAIIILISIIRRIYIFFKNKKKENPNPWRG
ncbi:hypothetical protein [Peribacillus loiseleuriae]|uniref:hypothetical protein n=1 Tax=Peribacillus loiseleuriae TaxID=1679170 RepID=UPI003D074FA7